MGEWWGDGRRLLAEFSILIYIFFDAGGGLLQVPGPAPVQSVQRRFSRHPRPAAEAVWPAEQPAAARGGCLPGVAAGPASAGGGGRGSGDSRQTAALRLRAATGDAGKTELEDEVGWRGGAVVTGFGLLSLAVVERTMATSFYWCF